MTIFQAIILGMAQDIGEFLPISSSAHLILIPWLFKWLNPGLTFEVALHIGTLLAIIAYFRWDWLTLFRHGLGKGLKTQEGKIFWYLVAASIPGSIAGAFLEQKAETTSRSPFIIGMMLMVSGIILYAADYFTTEYQDSKAISFWRSLIIGISQVFSVIPGVSSSGIMISSGLFLGLTKEEAARFSFFLSTPFIAGACFLKLRYLTSDAINLPFLVGVLTSALVGFLVIDFLLHWIRKKSFLPFVCYLLILGGSVMGLSFIFNQF